METITITVDGSKDGFGAFNEEHGIFAMGDNIKEVKQSVQDAIDTLDTLDEANRSKFLDAPYELVYNFDTQGLLEYYSGIFTFAAIQRITGINRKQIQHYSTGHRKPRLEQRKKIERGLHELANDMLQIEL